MKAGISVGVGSTVSGLPAWSGLGPRLSPWASGGGDGGRRGGGLSFGTAIAIATARGDAIWRGGGCGVASCAAGATTSPSRLQRSQSAPDMAGGTLPSGHSPLWGLSPRGLGQTAAEWHNDAPSRVRPCGLCAYSDNVSTIELFPTKMGPPSSARPLGLRGSRPSIRPAPANSLMSLDIGPGSRRRRWLCCVAPAAWGAGAAAAGPLPTEHSRAVWGGRLRLGVRHPSPEGSG